MHHYGHHQPGWKRYTSTTSTTTNRPALSYRQQAHRPQAPTAALTRSRGYRPPTHLPKPLHPNDELTRPPLPTRPPSRAPRTDPTVTPDPTLPYPVTKPHPQWRRARLLRSRRHTSQLKNRHRPQRQLTSHSRLTAHMTNLPQTSTSTTQQAYAKTEKQTPDKYHPSAQVREHPCPTWHFTA